MEMSKARLVRVVQTAGVPNPVCSVVVDYDEAMGWSATVEVADAQVEKVSAVIAVFALPHTRFVPEVNGVPRANWRGFRIEAGQKTLAALLNLTGRMLPERERGLPVLHYQLPEPDEDFTITLTVDSSTNTIVIQELNGQISGEAWEAYASGMRLANWPWLTSLEQKPDHITLRASAPNLEMVAEAIMGIMSTSY